MPAQRLPMRQVREVLRRKYVCGQSGHQIAAAIGVSRCTVAEYLRRAAVVGITWPVPPELDDVALEGRLFSPPLTPSKTLRPQPEWIRTHAELRRPGVTLLLLWQEYRAGQPEGYGYSRFCDLYAAWRGRLSPTLRQTHPAGERLFVDYAGQTVEMVDGATGEVRATAFECEDALHPGVISRHSTEDPERSRENIEIIRQREREGGSWGIDEARSAASCFRFPLSTGTD